MERTPLRHGPVPGFPGRRHRAALQIGEGLVVGRQQARAGAGLDRHVGDGQPPFDAHRIERAAAIFDDVAGAAGGAEPADDRKDQILRADGEAKRSFDPHLQGAGGPKQQGLRRKHMLDFAGADAERERAERAMSGGMAVAADDGRPGKGEALLRPDDMDDALLGRGRGDIGHAEQGDVRFQGRQLLGALRIEDREARRGGRQIMVGDGKREVGPAHLAACRSQAVEGLRRGHFMDEVTVDINEAGAVLAPLDHVRVPDLFVQGSRPLGHPQHPRLVAR
jgi:hypothetical protein